MKKNDKRFKNFMESIALKDVSSVRKEVIERCGVSVSCYYRWLEGSSTPTMERREKINGVAYKFHYPIVYRYAKGYHKY